jgi:hypothetical protein
MRVGLMTLYRRRCGNDDGCDGRGSDRETGKDIERHGVLALKRSIIH